MVKILIILMSVMGCARVKAISLKKPVIMNLSYPTRGEGDALFKGTAESNKIHWIDLKMFPADKRAHFSQITIAEGVNDLNSAIVHFKKASSLENFDIKQKVKGKKKPITTKKYNVGEVIEIDLSAAGWIPGNTYIYVISPDQKKAIFINPAYRLNFDWAKAEIFWNKELEK